jgi:hypothetical protein
MFIGRHPDGAIYGAWTCKQPNDEFHLGIEEVADDHVDYVTFKNRPLPIFIDPKDIKIAALETRLAALELGTTK